MTPIYAGLALTMLATLLTEIVVSRLLSVITWYHLSFVAISVAMLGAAAGAVAVFVVAPALHPRPERPRTGNVGRPLCRDAADLASAVTGDSDARRPAVGGDGRGGAGAGAGSDRDAVRNRRHRDHAGAHPQPRPDRPPLRRRPRRRRRPAASRQCCCSTPPTSAALRSPPPLAPPLARSASGARPDSAPACSCRRAGAGRGHRRRQRRHRADSRPLPEEPRRLDDAGDAQPVEHPRARPGVRAAGWAGLLLGRRAGRRGVHQHPGDR